MKESNPIEVSDYAISQGIDIEPAFAYWLPYVTRKRDRILNSINSRIAKASHKYGIEVPTSVEHARSIDARNNNRL